MAEITTTQAFSDGDTVTATKLNNITANAAIQTEAITNRSAETTVDQANDLLLMYDASATALKKISLSNVIKAGTASNFPVTGNATIGGTLGVTGNTTLAGALGVTGAISTQAGTAASPAIRPTSDTNTGIFFPAADTIAFSESGTEAMRIDSSGNVGIGTTEPSASLHISKSGAAFPSSSNPRIRLDETASGRFGVIEFDSSTNLNIWGSDTGFGSIRFFRGTGSGTESLRIDSNGNVGIGTTSPLSILHISKTGAAFPSSSNPRIRLEEVSSGRFGIIEFDSSTNLNIWGSDAGSGSIRFFNGTGSGTERLRIDSNGNVGIGTTSPLTKLDVRGVGYLSQLNLNYGIGTDGNAIINGGTNLYLRPQSGSLICDTNGTERLRITSDGEVYIAGTTDQGAYNLQVNGTGVWGAGAYVNGSDERLKENIQDITSGLDVVEKLRPVSFQYKEDYTADRSVQSGFIAQDLLVALEGKNYLEGVVSQGPTYYNVAYQNLIPILAKAIQELKAENDSLKTRITALEAA